MTTKKTETKAERAGVPGTALQAAVQAAYQAFAPYRAPTAGDLDVCTSCCMDVDLALQMSRLPLHQLTEKHFYEYNTSAKSTEQPADEIKYFAPRLLELLAEGARLHHSTELYLDRLGRCAPGAFSPAERAALQAVALAHFAQGLEQWGQHNEDIFQGEDAFTILLMWDYAGVSLQPLLNHWLACESDSATLHFVDACFWEYCWSGGKISNAFAEDRPEFHRTMQAWLTNPDVTAHWAERLMQLTERGPTSGWLPAGVRDHPRTPLHERINGVFDTMANQAAAPKQ